MNTMITPYATRLTRGTDLKQAIADQVRLHDLQAGSIASCVGCLSNISIRLAGARETLELQGEFEIVSLIGTLTPEHQHLHISVADTKGNVLGGHLLADNIIDTTAELIIHGYSHLSFEREFDQSTGFSELVVTKS